MDTFYLFFQQNRRQQKTFCLDTPVAQFKPVSPLLVFGITFIFLGTAACVFASTAYKTQLSLLLCLMKTEASIVKHRITRYKLAYLMLFHAHVN